MELGHIILSILIKNNTVYKYLCVFVDKKIQSQSGYTHVSDDFLFVENIILTVELSTVCLA